MNSNWRAEVQAIFRKEWLNEARTRSGLISSALFSGVAVVAIAFAAYQDLLTPSLAAGLLWVTLLFAGVVSLSRVFIGEEEAGTADLLRLIARPHAVFWGKALFNFANIAITALAVSVLLVALANLHVSNLTVYFLGLFGGCASLAGSVTLSGALAAQAANRSALLGSIGIPVLLPVVVLGIDSTRVAFGGLHQAEMSIAGLWCYAIAVFAISPWVFASTWKK